MKRLCIYVVYDKQNIVDSYIGVMLAELKRCVDKLVVVCNCLDLNKGKELLERYADDIFYRNNIGFDAGAFKDALCDFIGWKNVLQFDELLLINDTFYGPFFPMSDIFREMDKKFVDFWGLLIHGESKIYPEHIQSFFIAVEKRLLNCLEFRAYWENMPYYDSRKKAIMKHEIIFTDYFHNMGYSYDAYADVRVNISDNILCNYNQYDTIPYELISQRRFPFVKKKALYSVDLEKNSQEQCMQVLKYIQNKTTYDINLIWDNLIRTVNMRDIYNALHLHYTVKKVKRSYHDKVALLIFVPSHKSAEWLTETALKLEKQYDVYVCEDVKQCNNLAECVGMYEYVTVVCIWDCWKDEMPCYIEKKYYEFIEKNLLCNTDGIISIFDKYQRLGCLLLPQFHFGKFFRTYRQGWRQMRRLTKRRCRGLAAWRLWRSRIM